MNEEEDNDGTGAIVPAEETAAALPAVQTTGPAAPSIMTHAQARRTAMADLTVNAMAMTAGLTLTDKEKKALLAPFEDDCFQPGASGKTELIYIEHSALRDRLNSVLGPGAWALMVCEQWSEKYKTAKGFDAVRVYIRGMLIVRKLYISEAIGDMTYYPHNEATNFGDAYEGAQTAALRRCCKHFGVGVQAWSKDFCKGWWERRKNPGAQKPTPQPSKPAESVPTEAPGRVKGPEPDAATGVSEAKGSKDTGAAEKTPTAAQEQSAENPSTFRIDGLSLNVNVKQGSTEARIVDGKTVPGRPYTLYFIDLTDKLKAYTYSNRLGGVLQEAESAGADVTVSTELDKEGRHKISQVVKDEKK